MYLILSIFLLLSVIVSSQEPPQTTIIRPLNGEIFDTDKVKVDYVISGIEPKSAKIFINDKSVQLLNDIKTGQNTIILDVPASDCKISIIVKNDFGESSPAVVNLKRSEKIFKPTLYVLAIGISEYNNRDLRLRFAAKDAIDFSQTMMMQEGFLYEKVVLRRLINEEANATNIRDGLQWLQNETTFQDVAMLYMAGHGVNNNVGDFFFMPVNGDLDKINSTCVGYSEIKRTLDAVAGKMLVFMDACHSGNVLGITQKRALALTEAINDLTNAENGAIVFTSSTGSQYSLENQEWNNGAFTKALVEGLKGKADLFDKNTIYISNLSAYIANRVKELTKGKQAPTTIIPSSVPDFPIAWLTASTSVSKTEISVPKNQQTDQKLLTQKTDDSIDIKSPVRNLSNMGAIRVCGEYTWRAPKNVSLEEVEKKVLEQAKLAAMAENFGTTLSQWNTTVIKNESGVSDISFLSLGTSEVKGEWIEDIKIEYGNPYYERDMLVLSVSVCGIAREIIGAGIDFSAKILRNGTDARFESYEFKNRDDLYLLFSSPVEGFLAVYLVDEKNTTFCLLPYRNDMTGKVNVKAGKEYVFFSPKHEDKEATYEVEEYYLTCEKSVEQNYLYIIFSPNEFTKANDKYTGDETKTRELSFEEFLSWLSNNRMRDKDMKFETKVLTIRK